MSSEFDRQNLISIFVLEASDGLDVLTKALHPSDGGVPSPQELTDQYIIAHRLCGAAALYGFSGVAQLAEHMETLLEQVTPTPMAQWDQTVDLMRNITHGLQGIVRAIGQGGAEDVEAVARCWTSIKQREEEIGNATASLSSVTTANENYVLPELDAEILSYFLPEAEEYLSTMDELILTLRSKRDVEDSIYRLFRTAHTLKGSAYTVGYQVIGDVARPMEDYLVEVHEKRFPLSHDILDLMAKAAELIRLILQREPASLPKLQQDIPLLLNRLTQVFEGTATLPPPATHSYDIQMHSMHSVQPEPVVNLEAPIAQGRRF